MCLNQKWEPDWQHVGQHCGNSENEGFAQPSVREISHLSYVDCTACDKHFVCFYFTHFLLNQKGKKVFLIY